MRCARCDRIAIPQVLARAPDGRLVFGWCPACLASEHCEVVDTPAVPLTVSSREPISRRLRRLRRVIRLHLRRPRPASAGRRLAAMGVAGLMTAWALILAFIGGLKLARTGDGRGFMLLTGSGVMALLSLSVWIAVIGRAGGSSVILKVLQVASAIVAFGTLAWGILHHEPAKDPIIVLVAAIALGVSWIARRMELKRSARSRPSVAIGTRSED